MPHLPDQNIVLVDENDQKIGTLEKTKAHQSYNLHRAVSIFLFNNDGEFLLQRRAKTKYHAPYLWTNACCTHPYDNEQLWETCDRRLREELGIKCKTQPYDKITYAAQVGDLFEFEFVHIFIGKFNGQFSPNKEEVVSLEWVSIDYLFELMDKETYEFTPWLKIYRGIIGASEFKNIFKAL